MFLALTVLTGGIIISLMLSIILLSDQYGIYVFMPTMAVTLTLFWLISAKVDPESLENPFT